MTNLEILKQVILLNRIQRLLDYDPNQPRELKARLPLAVCKKRPEIRILLRTSGLFVCAKAPFGVSALFSLTFKISQHFMQQSLNLPAVGIFQLAMGHMVAILT